MATIAVTRLNRFDRQQSLLSLDCSADLRSYSRNLGPGVQEKIFQRTSEALRAQLEEHRDFLLRHNKSDLVQVSPVPHLLAPAPLAVPISNIGKAQSHIIHAYGMAAALPQTPRFGDINSYPPALRDALDRSAALQRPDDDAIYHVMEDIQSTYMEDSKRIAKICDNVQEANEEVVRLFLEEGYYTSGTYACNEAEYEVFEFGGLRCAIETDGSTGGFTEIYVLRHR
ncbi:Nn.00g099100.m01.CDS01 [Neocucurbitaria sp. VM-36]